MRFAISVAALAGAAMAAPGAGYGYPEGKPADNVVVEWTTVVKTVYVTEGYEAATSTAAYEAPAVTTTPVYEAPAYPTSKYEEPAYSPAPEVTYAPEPTPTPQPAPAAPANSGYMAVVDEWRSKMGLSALACSTKLEANALDTVTEGNGQMKHKLNDGTYGQVLAPGGADDFEHVFVGGWLCEMPNLPGLNGVCAQQSNGWNYMGQTGHAEILTNTAYKSIGCALKEGIWACDLGY